MKKQYEISVDEQRCKKCGICVAFCPKNVLEIGINTVPKVAFPEACIGCRWCYLRCPEIAIFVEKKEAV
ncbi:MAG: 4Fe-4S binding protein [Tepidanaerobacteraceae bacterium]|jgi:2-oxoglutarate ferredoxin oxidoreductase subunit delta|nr:4Fe-4S binding protein [Tepidanaerobacteraceae bacterium]